MNPAAARATNLLQKATKKTASDIHIHPNNESEKVNVFFRINGLREVYKTMTLNEYQLLLTYFKFSSGMDIGEVRRPQHGTIHRSLDKANYSFRLATLPVHNQESLSIRILPQEERFDPERLFLFPNQFKQMQHWFRKKSGLILATGPTGCGKSTTIYSLLENRLREESVQIVTIEDPIERLIDGLLQVEVNEKAGINYHTGLKAALRHDPDIIMFGEIRDKQTAKIAIRAALTGHLVISTVHASNSISTIDRLLDLGITRENLQQTLVAIIALQLIPIETKLLSRQRVAIGELLDSHFLQMLIKGDNDQQMIKTFNDLKRKAYAYGFISEELINDS